MKALCLSLIVFLLITTFSCSQKRQSQDPVTEHLAQYRDTIVGNFSGYQIDTLICEPLDSISDPSYRGFHYRWRVYAKNGSVEELEIGNTIGINFVKEGDLDGDGADEWGYVTEWATSNWMMYKVFTYKNKQASFLYRPLPIYLPHLDPDDKDFMTTCKDSLASQSFSPGMVKVKFSDVRNEGIDFLVVDTVVPMLIKIR